jgi:hypothetical protein
MCLPETLQQMSRCASFVYLEEAKMFRFVFTAGALAALTLSAAAQTSTTTTTTGVGATGEFYVVQDAATKKCTIVDKKPTTTTMVQVGPAAFKTRTEAESGMKSIQVCTN